MSTRQDADATTVASNGPPSEHPYAHISRHNDAKSPLLRLPLEIRLEIYELAVKEDRAIRPRQVTKGSNLFVWGDAKCARHHPGLQEFSWLQTNRTLLTVTALLATCQAIHADLRERPVFYRVNTFKFSSAREIHDYLAALTPARRNAIREIVCAYKQFSPDRLYWDSMVPNDFNDVLPILAHCRDLRSFKIVRSHAVLHPSIFPVDSDNSISMWRTYQERLRRLALRAEEDNGHDATVWSLSSLRLDYEFPGQFSKPLMQELTDIKALLQQALARRQRAANRTDLKACFTLEDMQRAVQRARVDFVGEVRLTRDRGEADGAPIASRTRSQKAAKHTTNEYGTLKSPIGPKYDFNGHLQWNFASIKEVRWSSHGIECQVAYYPSNDPKGQAWPSSYEPIHVLGTEYALERLRVYFSQYPEPEQTLAAMEQTIEQMQSMPSPRDCAQEHPGMMTNKSRRSMWKTLQRNWVRTIDNLQLYARHFKSRDRAKPGGEGEEAQSAEPGDKREAENTIHCAAPPRKKART